MVYAFIQRQPFAKTIGTELVGSKDGNLRNVPYLEPEKVDRISLSSSTPMEQGYLVDSTAVPKSICWKSNDKPIPDVEKCRGVEIISTSVREIIEKYDSGIHQFLPVDVFQPKKKDPIARYYRLVVGRRIDSPDVGHTTQFRRPSGVWDPVPGGKFVFSRAAIGSANLWRDPFIPACIFCSSGLGKALLEAKVTGLVLQEFEEV